MRTYTKKVFGSQTAKVGRGQCLHKSIHQAGFTLVELLVVVVIIGILGALLLPALSRSKARAQAIMCMNNSRTLAFSWTMYSGDNNERLAYNLGASAQLHTSFQQNTPNWVNNAMDWELTPGDTNLNFVNQSILAPYERVARIYHCPADTALSVIQKNAGWTSRVRSISMNAMVGDPGNLLQGNSNVNNPGYQQFVRENDFRDPASIFVFLDEHPDSIDDGYFLDTTINPLAWVDLPASYHNGGGSFSFADGHTEIHRWQSVKTLQPARPEINLPITVDANDRADFDWVIKHESFASQ